MPNHVKTVVKFKHLKPDDIAIILNTIATDKKKYDEDLETDNTYQIDFNKIIPEPETEDECPEEYKVNKDSHVRPSDEKPWFNWYKWHIENWGTKWDAYDCYTLIGKSWITFVFSTAWSPALPIFDKLALLGYDIDIKYADEDYGSNCGTAYWTSEQGWTHYDESELKDPVRFARNLWNKY